MKAAHPRGEIVRWPACVTAGAARMPRWNFAEPLSARVITEFVLSAYASQRAK
jgi:hypothetical protein